MSEVRQKVIEITSKVLGIKPERITDNASFVKDLASDSLLLVEVLLTLEDTFGGKISDDDLTRINTVGEAVNYIESWLKKK